MRDYFEGWYFKHQKGENTLALIPGRSNDTAFIQIITQNQSFHVDFPLSDYEKKGIVTIGRNSFSEKGICVDIHSNGIDLSGQIGYEGLTPLESDIMGPFRFLPMQCRHGVVSMSHRLKGTLTLNGQVFDFTGGTGYIETDSGRSFPKNYLWMQCNDHNENDSIMVSIAKIPFMGFWFWGCICAVYHAGKQYRLATYKGVKICSRVRNKIELRQGKLHLVVDLPESYGHILYAPEKGSMVRLIRESAAVSAHFRFSVGSKVLFDAGSDNASVEFV